MSIEYEIIPCESSFITAVFEKGDFQVRDEMISNCFDRITRFYSDIFTEFVLLLFITVEDSKVNQYYGIWRILKEKFKIELPKGAYSECSRIKDGDRIYICKIQASIENIHAALEVVKELRNSILVFGDSSEESWNLDHILTISEKLHSTDPCSWIPLINYLSRNGRIGMRVFGEFDDIENGFIVYEPLPFYQKYGDWNSR